MGGGAFLCVRMFAVSPRPLDDAQLGGFSSFAKRRGPLHKRVVLDEQVPAEYTGLQLWELHATDAMRPNRIHVESMVAERARREER